MRDTCKTVFQTAFFSGIQTSSLLRHHGPTNMQALYVGCAQHRHAITSKRINHHLVYKLACLHSSDSKDFIQNEHFTLHLHFAFLCFLVSTPTDRIVYVSVYVSYFIGLGWNRVHLVYRPLIGVLHQPRMIDDEECAAVGGMRVGRGNRSTWRKPAPVTLCPSQIPHDLTWPGTRVATVGKVYILLTDKGFKKFKLGRKSSLSSWFCYFKITLLD
jgi:hypothetical protein